MSAFTGYAKWVQAGASVTGIACLWNPANSGVTATVKSISGVEGTPVTFILRQVTAPEGSVSSTPAKNATLGGAAPKCELREGNVGWSLGITLAASTATTNTQVHMDNAVDIVIAPGYGVVLQSNQGNMSGDATVQWTEAQA